MSQSFRLVNPLLQHIHAIKQVVTSAAATEGRAADDCHGNGGVMPYPALPGQPTARSATTPATPPVLILDGAMGTELERRGADIGGGDGCGGQLWSSGQLLTLEGRERVSAIHLDYLRAGADVITTCTYQVNEHT
jgi:hypothetical protein